MDHSDCQDSLRSTRLGSRFKLHDSFFVCWGRAWEGHLPGRWGQSIDVLKFSWGNRLQLLSSRNCFMGYWMWRLNPRRLCFGGQGGLLDRHGHLMSCKFSIKSLSLWVPGLGMWLMGI